MFAFEWIAEQRIREAIERGQFNNLPGEGKPLNLDDYWQQDPEHRMAYIVLKNSGYLPPRLYLRKEIERLSESVAIEMDRLRRRMGRYRERITEVWEAIAPYFASERALLDKLDVLSVPGWLRPTSISYAMSTTRRPRGVDRRTAELRRLFLSYNACLDGSRSRIWDLLAAVDERQAELDFEKIKSEVRRDLHVRVDVPNQYVDTDRLRREFDREFRRLEFGGSRA